MASMVLVDVFGGSANQAELLTGQSRKFLIGERQSGHVLDRPGLNTPMEDVFRPYASPCASAKSIAAQTAATCAALHCSGVARGLSG